MEVRSLLPSTTVMRGSEKNSSPGTPPSNILLLLYVYLYNTVVERFSISSVGPSAVLKLARTWRRGSDITEEEKKAN